MFSSENILLHDSISTLELKNFNVRWYPKEAILTDRALYLYKEKSNYVHDAHQRLSLAKFQALLPTESASNAYAAELPPATAPHDVLVEILNKETQKRRILACQTDEKAAEFVGLFNLVSSLSRFDEAVAEHQHRLDRKDKAQHDASFAAQGQDPSNLLTKANQKRIE